MTMKLQDTNAVTVSHPQPMLFMAAANETEQKKKANKTVEKADLCKF